MKKMKIEYWFEMPNKWTFKQPKLLSFISKFIPYNAQVLIPFAGYFRFGQIDNSKFTYNDLNKDIDVDYNMEAYRLKERFPNAFFDCIIADPPYSHYQGKKSYSGYNIQRITDWRRTANYLLKPNGIYIELGYNSSGLGKDKAEKIALGVCCLGGSHNDILILVQKKYNNLNECL